MARGDYGPEIKTSMGSGRSPKPRTSPPSGRKPTESPADIARDKKAGIAEGSSQDQRLDAMPSNQAGGQASMQRSPQPSPMQGGNSPAHAAMAASIAHAILGKGGAY